VIYYGTTSDGSSHCWTRPGFIFMGGSSGDDDSRILADDERLETGLGTEFTFQMLVDKDKI
jgi:hypothetical protein